MQGGGRISRSRQGAGQARQRRLLVRNYIIMAAVALLLVAGYWFFVRARSTADLTVHKLPCTADQDVTPFGRNILYYDGSTLYSLTSGGSVRWSQNLGPGRRFAVGGSSIAAWYGSDLTIMGEGGNATYKDNLGETVQFARLGKKFFAAVVGEDTSATLLVRNLDGTSVDEEREAFSNMLLMDTGFYGENDQYLWSLCLDVYGTAINSVLNTFQVGKMNTGVVNLGEFLAYKVLFENNRLRVFTTQQMYTYDYKGAQNVSGTMLVYGWQLIDWAQPERGGAYMLLAPTSQLSSTAASSTITELRVLNDSQDRRYHLPSSCVGAAISGRKIYGVSSSYLYVADVDEQRFYGYRLPLPEGTAVTRLLGVTTEPSAIVACGSEVYSISLPR